MMMITTAQQVRSVRRGAGRLIATAVALGSALLLVAPLAAQAAAPVYRPVAVNKSGVIFLAQSQGGNPVNARGQVAGRTLVDDFDRAAVLDQTTGRVRVLGTFGGASSAATDINKRGDVVGYAQTAAGDDHAFLVRAGSSTLRDLGTLGGSDSRARGINDKGVVVGESYTADGQQHAFRWTPSRRMTKLFRADVDSQAVAINKRGDVIGSFDGEPAFLRAGRKAVIPLGALPDHPFGRALDLNNHGVVVGSATSVGDDSERPFVWTLKSRTLKQLPGRGFGGARVVNDHGVIGGDLTPGYGEATQAVIWNDCEVPLTVFGVGGHSSDVPNSAAFAIDRHGVVIGPYGSQLVRWVRSAC